MTMCCLLVLASVAFVAALPAGLNSDGSLDKEIIRKFYFDGEFEKVTQALENFRKQNPDANEVNKIFMFKHLSVVYAANPDTRLKGESYMYQLLKLVPSVTLIDMYISDNIKAIFKNVKTDYQERHSLLEKQHVSTESSSVALEDKSQEGSTEAANSGSRKWMWWTAGGVALAGAVTVFILVSGDDEPESDPPSIAN